MVKGIGGNYVFGFDCDNPYHDVVIYYEGTEEEFIEILNWENAFYWDVVAFVFEGEENQQQ